MWKVVDDRELGKIRPASFASHIQSARASSLHLSNRKEFVTAHKGAVNSFQVDLTEKRYLLSGASDGSIAVYDVQHATDYNGGGLVAKHTSLFVVDKRQDFSHKYSVSSVAWYPVDTGLFMTGSLDHYVKVWDTNTVQVEMNFKMPGKVYGIAMSSVSTSHMLIAAVSEDVQVRLCDISSGAFSHTLSGHRDGVWAVQWSTSNEWVLVTGGCDGAIRFWDIRRAGCFRVLDQFQTQFGRRPPLLKSSTKGSVPESSVASTSASAKVKVPQKKAPCGGGAKQSSINKGWTKGSVLQRQHPGMLSSRNRASAHYGAVTGLKVTEDGMYLLSAGTDSRLRLWDIESGRNTLVNYEAMRLQTNKPIQLAVTPDTELVFVPGLTAARAYDIWSGRTILTFRGHYECVNCCWFNSQDQELYTGSNDRQILVWSPDSMVEEEVENNEKGPKRSLDEDCWSD
ncbi:hypothetical protein AMTRI_Chr11g150540 [Amborella trichopoda]|uniref:Uncharacterized protein n=1 Tax=Amborella trichopoda TaxID=13333 RepID=W1PXX5_AMBTC|nr:DNA excision repair protein ERCC-8 [Amborella trichopoda]ERN13123.1 hypothetical protein AMTR_s00040p00175180 [Amborella trichopoda]|eukprot:XP_006851542.1 DNA excision repair protein ERCC-8 [Amborella trichopoda]